MERLLDDLPLWYKQAVMEHDYEAESRMREMGMSQDIWFISCQRLLENRAFTDLMQNILKTLERVYETPVDIEYAINLDRDGEFVVNLLQCRPLYLGGENEAVDLDSARACVSRSFFEVQGASMGPSRHRTVDVVVQIDPARYNAFPYTRKAEVATAVGRLNRHYANTGKNLLLMAPGRVGTSSPELGVPTRFADISCFSEICEVSDSRTGFMPELSYGSHMFQDMVEAEMTYSAIWNDPRTLKYMPELLVNEPDLFPEICPDLAELQGLIVVREPCDLHFWLDSVKNHALCGIIGQSSKEM
jgi:hypothetical protein